MELFYTGKKSPETILLNTPCAELSEHEEPKHKTQNALIKGENLTVMQTLLTQFKMSRTIDLVYIDPPFATNNVFRHNGERTATISSKNSDNVAYTDILVGPDYIEYIRERLVFLKELLNDAGSIYVHIDYKIGHYIKVIMDEIFGEKYFRNDIARIKCNPKNFARKGYSNIKDLILFYTKTDDFIWNEPSEDFSEEDIKRLFPKIDSEGRRYTTTPLHAPGETTNGNTGKPWRGLNPPIGRHWRYDPSILEELDKQGLIEWSNTGNPRKIIYADDAITKGKRIQDIWEFKDSPYPNYPTQKNIDLLKNIIKTSSKPNGLVMDCFCGSGTTLLAADQLGRSWIGIDKSEIAIKCCLESIAKPSNLFGNGLDFKYYEQISHQPVSAS